MKKLIAVLMCLLVLLTVSACGAENGGEASQDVVSVLSSYGSRGSEVRQIQTRLKKWGYYNGAVDGIYGSQTFNAVKSFQRKNGLTVDGIAGPRTLAAMGISSSSSSSSSTRGNNVNLLSRIIAAEARGESYTGQVAVGAVILNRVEHPSFPNTLAGVIYQSGAFSSVANGQLDSVSVTSTNISAAEAAYNGWDPTGGCLYFYNPSKTNNAWIKSLPATVTIGDHVFSTG